MEAKGNRRRQDGADGRRDRDKAEDGDGQDDKTGTMVIISIESDGLHVIRHGE